MAFRPSQRPFLIQDPAVKIINFNLFAEKASKPSSKAEKEAFRSLSMERLRLYNEIIEKSSNENKASRNQEFLSRNPDFFHKSQIKSTKNQEIALKAQNPRNFPISCSNQTQNANFFLKQTGNFQAKNVEIELFASRNENLRPKSLEKSLHRSNSFNKREAFFDKKSEDQEFQGVNYQTILNNMKNKAKVAEKNHDLRGMEVNYLISPSNSSKKDGFGRKSIEKQRGYLENNKGWFKEKLNNNSINNNESKENIPPTGDITRSLQMESLKSLRGDIRADNDKRCENKGLSDNKGDNMRGGDNIRGGDHTGGDHTRGDHTRGGDPIRGGDHIKGGDPFTGGDPFRGGDHIRGGDQIRGGEIRGKKSSKDNMKKQEKTKKEDQGYDKKREEMSQNGFNKDNNQLKKDDNFNKNNGQFNKLETKTNVFNNNNGFFTKNNGTLENKPNNNNSLITNNRSLNNPNPEKITISFEKPNMNNIHFDRQINNFFEPKSPNDQKSNNIEKTFEKQEKNFEKQEKNIEKQEKNFEKQEKNIEKQAKFISESSSKPPLDSSKKNDFQEYKRLQEKLLFLENRIVEMKSNFETAQKSCFKEMRPKSSKILSEEEVSKPNNKPTLNNNGNIVNNINKNHERSISQEKNSKENQGFYFNKEITMNSPKSNPLKSVFMQEKSDFSLKSLVTQVERGHFLPSNLETNEQKLKKTPKSHFEKKQNSFSGVNESTNMTREKSPEKNQKKYQSLSRKKLYYIDNIVRAFHIMDIKPNEDLMVKLSREHFTQTFQSIVFSMGLKPINPQKIKEKALSLPRKDSTSNKLS